MSHNTRTRGDRKDNAVNSVLRTVWWETYELWDQVLYCVGGIYYKARRPAR